VANFRGTALCGTELSRTGALGRVVVAFLLASVMLVTASLGFSSIRKLRDLSASVEAC
jgi:hypothetical protein